MADQFSHNYLLICATGTFVLSTFVSFGIANNYIKSPVYTVQQSRKFTSSLNKFNNQKSILKLQRHIDTLKKCSTQSHRPIEQLFIIPFLRLSTVCHSRIDFVFFYLVHLFYSSFVLSGLFPHAWSPFWYCWLVLSDMIIHLLRWCGLFVTPVKVNLSTGALWTDLLCGSFFT